MHSRCFRKPFERLLLVFDSFLLVIRPTYSVRISAVFESFARVDTPSDSLARYTRGKAKPSARSKLLMRSALVWKPPGQTLPRWSTKTVAPSASLLPAFTRASTWALTRGSSMNSTCSREREIAVRSSGVRPNLSISMAITWAWLSSVA
eukprot:31289-Pelagococcus_subviridis.AAC.4